MVEPGICLAPLAVAGALLSQPAWGQELLFADRFQNGLTAWQARSPGDARIVEEPGTANRVLRLTPRQGDFSHVILDRDIPAGTVRMQGRFMFPTEGDGYLGFVYNLRASEQRTDFGCLYVKSNGSYIRISPHYDGNPSWRLYEEFRVDLEGERRIQTKRWHAFRLDVQGRAAALYVDDFTVPAAVFDAAPHASGRLGLEARPGRGEPVWVDDIQVSTLTKAWPVDRPPAPEPRTALRDWRYLPAQDDADRTAMDVPRLPDQGWRPLEPDGRGAVITGLLTQYISGARDVVWLRTSWEAGDAPAALWLALSTANRLDVWLNGEWRGSAAPEPFIWSDHATTPGHMGARLALVPAPGRNELLVRVAGRRFAGGGFFATLLTQGAP